MLPRNAIRVREIDAAYTAVVRRVTREQGFPDRAVIPVTVSITPRDRAVFRRITAIGGDAPARMPGGIPPGSWNRQAL